MASRPCRDVWPHHESQDAPAPSEPGGQRRQPPKGASRYPPARMPKPVACSQTASAHSQALWPPPANNARRHSPAGHCQHGEGQAAPLPNSYRLDTGSARLSTTACHQSRRCRAQTGSRPPPPDSKTATILTDFTPVTVVPSSTPNASRSWYMPGAARSSFNATRIPRLELVGSASGTGFSFGAPPMASDTRKRS